MFKDLTYKKKVRLLVAGFFIFLFISYFLSIKKTFRLKSRCSDFKEKLTYAEHAPAQILQFEKKLKEIENIIGINIKEFDFQELLYEKVSNYCQENGLILVEFPGTHSYEEQEYEVETNIVVVEGVFLKLLKLVYILEQKDNPGKVVSVKFATKMDYKTRKTRLNTSMYFQNIKSKKR